MSAPRVAVIGAGGHGAKNLARVTRFDAEGRVRLVAVGDPNPPAPGSIPAHTRTHADGLDLLAAEQVDVVVISTPIHTHFPIASAAVAAGADVLLEKPTTATLAEFDALTALADAHGARVQIGFQSLGCHAIGALRTRIAAGEIGEVQRFAATGAWVRDRAYWNRVRWAGKRTLDGRIVADGVLTNPLAHATATALAISGSTRREHIDDIVLDLHRANDIEADDTSAAVLTLRDGRRLTTAVTLAAARNGEPYADAVGETGTLRLFYKTGVVQHLALDGGIVAESSHPFDELLDDLLDARADGTPLAAPIAETGAFMRLVDAVMTAPEPHPIDAAHVIEVDDDLGAHRVVTGVEQALQRALQAESTFTALGEPFAVDP